VKKVVAILVSILFILSVTGLCFAQASPAVDKPAVPADKAKAADKKGKPPAPFGLKKTTPQPKSKITPLPIKLPPKIKQASPPAVPADKK